MFSLVCIFVQNSASEIVVHFARVSQQHSSEQHLTSSEEAETGGEGVVLGEKQSSCEFAASIPDRARAPCPLLSSPLALSPQRNQSIPVSSRHSALGARLGQSTAQHSTLGPLARLRIAADADARTGRPRRRRRRRRRPPPTRLPGRRAALRLPRHDPATRRAAAARAHLSVRRARRTRLAQPQALARCVPFVFFFLLSFPFLSFPFHRGPVALFALLCSALLFSSVALCLHRSDPPPALLSQSASR